MEQNETTPPSGGSSKTAIIVVVILILAIAAWFGFAKKNNTESDSTKSETKQVNSTQSETKSMKELLASGKAMQCVYETTSDDSTITGNTYIAGGKMRGDFNSTTAGKTTASHMVSDGKTMYTWIDGTGQGYKMSIEATTQPTQTQQQESVDLNAKYDYRCSDWTVDQSKLEAPSNITFTDMSEMMKQSIPGTSSTTQTNTSGDAAAKVMQCAACDSLTGDQKTQCRAALYCE